VAINPVMRKILTVFEVLLLKPVFAVLVGTNDQRETENLSKFHHFLIESNCQATILLHYKATGKSRDIHTRPKFLKAFHIFWNLYYGLLFN
jgi:hypothetical protein